MKKNCSRKKLFKKKIVQEKMVQKNGYRKKKRFPLKNYKFAIPRYSNQYLARYTQSSSSIHIRFKKSI